MRPPASPVMTIIIFDPLTGKLVTVATEQR